MHLVVLAPFVVVPFQAVEHRLQDLAGAEERIETVRFEVAAMNWSLS
jgi:hypothetical protein